jgi:amino-acid N-acetyltransferase
MPMAVTIRPARPEDLVAIVALLQEHHLPLEGLADHLSTTMVASLDDRVVGSAALERYDDGALLRSVAVPTAFQGAGLGRQLTEAAIALAGRMAVPAVFLLTTTAAAYFPKFGFERIERAQVPLSVQRSVEFTSACPSSAIVMRKILRL